MLAAIASVWTAIADGRVTPDEAGALSLVVERSIQVIQLQDVLKRSTPWNKREVHEMKKEISKRLDTLESPRLKNQRAAERQDFLDAASQIVLAYYLGGLKPTETPLEGYARALGFENLPVINERLVLESANVAELESRHNDAVRRLFSELDDDRFSPETLEEAIIEMAKRLPDEWRAWITKEVEKVDYEKQTRPEEREERDWPGWNYLLRPRQEHAVGMESLRNLRVFT